MTADRENAASRRLAVINTGSSTLKLATFTAIAGEVRTSSAETFEWGSEAEMEQTVREALETIDVEPQLVGHRVVHGADH